MNALIEELQAFATAPVAPFWFATDQLPGLDFNRDIVAAGTNDNYPDGALGIRADGDFWAVAALPLKFTDVPLPEIVNVLWPQFSEKAQYTPDSGTVEQKLWFLRERIKTLERSEKRQSKVFHEQREEIERLKFGRRELGPYRSSKKRRSDSYFVAQYTRLLVATAHEFVARHDYAGVCTSCGLGAGDRVHMNHYIKKKAELGDKIGDETFSVSHLWERDDDET